MLKDVAGPTGLLQGMHAPHAWVEALATHMTTIPPVATAVVGRLPTGLWAVALTLADLNRHVSPMQVLLVPYPEQVRITLWTAAWKAAGPPLDEQYLALRLVAQALIVAAQQCDDNVVVLQLSSAAFRNHRA